jgi:hypothetical protein
VTHLTTDDGTLAAKLTTLGHLVPFSTLSVEHRLLDPAPDGRENDPTTKATRLSDPGILGNDQTRRAIV